MIVSIMQPAYLPWLGYFERMAMSDLHIVLDHVQIDASSKTKFANRNRFRTPEGWCWLTVPLRTKGTYGQRYLDQIEIANDTPWAQKHWRTLQHNYGTTPGFAAHRDFFEGVFKREWMLLNDLLRETSTYLCQTLEVKRETLYSSRMNVGGEKSELILNLCRAVGATRYLSGPFGRDYLDHAAFAEVGIDIVYHDFQHPVYPQHHPGFEPYMSACDLLFNCGEKSRQVLANNCSAVWGSKGDASENEIADEIS